MNAGKKKTKTKPSQRSKVEPTLYRRRSIGQRRRRENALGMGKGCTRSTMTLSVSCARRRLAQRFPMMLNWKRREGRA